MGYSRKRVGADGKAHYQAIYTDGAGNRVSAGTFRTKRDSDKAWQREEAKVAEGKLGDARRGKITFRSYVEKTWLPNHQLEFSTRQRYAYSIEKHLMPEFGDARMIDLLPAHVRSWVTKLAASGVSPTTIQANKTILSAIFTTALNDQVIYLHPCKGVKTPTVRAKARVIITPNQFDAVYHALPNDSMRLLVETAIESGLRWGELTELRPIDLDIASRILTVNRAVVELVQRFNPGGGRFLVKDYPKNTKPRRVKLAPEIAGKLASHIEATSLGPSDLLFTIPGDSELGGAPSPPPPSGDLGLTEPNAAGRRYRHGTLTAYSLGQCRCAYCAASYRGYRAARRAAGKDRPASTGTSDAKGHIGRAWFRKAVWTPALAAAEINVPVRMHDLRHAHASWLLAGGADLQTVKERLGHGSLRTTERYLHSLPDADDTALDALQRIRGSASR